MPLLFNHIHVYWAEDTFVRRWLEGLAARFRLVQYDGRGQGMSSRGLNRNVSVLDLVHDLETLVDRLNLEKFVLMAANFGQVAVNFAFRNPHRLEALILDSCPVDAPTWSSTMYMELAEKDWNAFLHSQAALGRAPDVAASVRRLHQTITQADWRVLRNAEAASSIKDVLPHLRVPTLVLHPRDVLLPVEEAIRLAAAIPNAQLVLIDGATQLGDAAQGISAIESFLGSLTDLMEPTPAAVPGRHPDDLSARELEVLRLLSGGRSNPEIANELVISAHTVNRHVSNIFAKIGVSNRTEAAVYARDHGLI